MTIDSVKSSAIYVPEIEVETSHSIPAFQPNDNDSITPSDALAGSSDSWLEEAKTQFWKWIQLLFPEWGPGTANLLVEDEEGPRVLFTESTLKELEDSTLLSGGGELYWQPIERKGWLGSSVTYLRMETEIQGVRWQIDRYQTEWKCYREGRRYSDALPEAIRQSLEELEESYTAYKRANFAERSDGLEEMEDQKEPKYIINSNLIKYLIERRKPAIGAHPVEEKIETESESISATIKVSPSSSVVQIVKGPDIFQLEFNMEYDLIGIQMNGVKQDLWGNLEWLRLWNDVLNAWLKKCGIEQESPRCVFSREELADRIVGAQEFSRRHSVLVENLRYKKETDQKVAWIKEFVLNRQISDFWVRKLLIYITKSPWLSQDSEIMLFVDPDRDNYAIQQNMLFIPSNPGLTKKEFFQQLSACIGWSTALE